MNNYYPVSKKIFQKIIQADNILITSHRQPDGDALGSLTAFIILLNQLNKNYQVFCDGIIPLHYSFLPQINQIINNKNQLNFQNYDLMIVLDCGDLKLTNLTDELSKNNELYLINIDHHASNSNYGDLNLVLPTSASCTEVITQLFRQNNIKINQTMATCLLTGIITDTNNFANPTTSQTSLKIASHLMNCGAQLNQIINKTLRNKNLGALRFWGEIINRLNYNKQTNIVSTVITNQDIKLNNISEHDTNGLIGFLNTIIEARAVLLLKENTPGIIKGSWRSNNAHTDVSKLAKLLGGGGHRQAAAFTIEGRLRYNGTGWMII